MKCLSELKLTIYLLFFTCVTGILLFQPVARCARENTGAQQLLQKALFELKSGNDTEGIRLLLATIDKFPDSVSAQAAYYSLGRYYSLVQNYDKALQYLNELNNKYVSGKWPAMSLVQIGNILLKSRKAENEDQAMDDFNSALDTSTDQEVAHRVLIGKAYLNLRYRELDQMEAGLTQVIVDGSTPETMMEAYWALGLLNVYRDRPEAALVNFQKGAVLRKENYPQVKNIFKGAIRRLVAIYINHFSRMRVRRKIILEKEHLSAPEDLTWNQERNLVVLGKKNTVGIISTDNLNAGWQYIHGEKIQHLGSGRYNSCLIISKKNISENNSDLTLKYNIKQKYFISAAWTTPGEYWVLNKKTKSILKFTEDGTVSGSITKFEVDSDDLVVPDIYGGTWILFRSDSTLRFFSARAENTKTIHLKTPPLEISKPIDIAVDNLGLLYLLDAGNNTLHVFSPGGKHITAIEMTRFLGEIRAPSAITCDVEGRIYVADRKNNVIYQLD